MTSGVDHHENYILTDTDSNAHTAKVWDSSHLDVILAKTVKWAGMPNVYGAHIPVESRWNLKLFESLLGDYHDREVVEFLRYGWPANRLPGAPVPSRSYVKHKSAVEFPSDIDRYIEKELKLNNVMGPFTSIPFTGQSVGISPLSTREKRDTTERCTILDLSYPKGILVNDWTSKDNYLGFDIKLRFPTVDDLACRIEELGPSCHMWKCDMATAFRQVPLDPASYELFGYIWEGLLYWDKVLVMGHGVAPYICQHVTETIKHIHNQIGYFLLNYVDDFLGAELQELAEKSYEMFGRLLKSLGVRESETKAVPPSYEIEFLDVGFNSIASIMFVTPARMEELRDNCGCGSIRTPLFAKN